MNCQLCGTKVKVVGHTTKHYEPVVDREMLIKIMSDTEIEVTRGTGRDVTRYELADAIISAMYGGEK